MANMFDDDFGSRGPPLPKAAPPPTSPQEDISGLPRFTVTPAPRPNMFDDASGGAPAAPAAPQYNKPFGELKPTDESWSQWLKWKAMDALSAIGAPNYTAQRLGNAAVDVASLAPPIGIGRAAADLSYDLPRGNAGAAALDVLGMAPVLSSQTRMLNPVARTVAPTVRVAETPVLRARDYGTATQAADYVQPGKIFGLGTPGAGAENRAAFEAAVNARQPGVMQPAQIPQSLQEAGRAGYRFSEVSPLVYHPDAMSEYTGAMQAYLQHPHVGTGVFTPESAPELFSTLDRFAHNFPRGGNRPITATDWDTLRQQLRALKGASGSGGGQAVEQLDRYMTQIAPQRGMLVNGTSQDIADLQNAFDWARGNWRSYKTARGVQDVQNYADLRNAGVHSGRNQGNITRQELLQFMSPSGESRLYGATDAERQAIADAIRGDWATNTARSISNRLGAGGGIMQTGLSAGLGAAAGTAAHLIGFGPSVSVPASMAGYALPETLGRTMRGIANERTSRAAANVVGDIRRNSPLYQAREAYVPPPGMPGSAGAPVADPRIQARDAIANALMPQFRQYGTQWWNSGFVPYENRGQERPWPWTQ